MARPRWGYLPASQLLGVCGQMVYTEYNLSVTLAHPQWADSMAPLLQGDLGEGGPTPESFLEQQMNDGGLGVLWLSGTPRWVKVGAIEMAL